MATANAASPAVGATETLVQGFDILRTACTILTIPNSVSNINILLGSNVVPSCDLVFRLPNRTIGGRGATPAYLDLTPREPNSKKGRHDRPLDTTSRLTRFRRALSRRSGRRRAGWPASFCCCTSWALVC